MTQSRINPALLSKRVAQSNISCPTMVITLFGDAISQHGNWIWLGSLIDTLAPFGYNERLVRTAVYRLAQQDWLQINKVGRRSYYGFTELARHQYEKAARRIYSAGQQEWDGVWTLVCPTFVPDDVKEVFRKNLLWQGFNTLVNGMYAHPSSERTSLDETLHELNLLDKVVVFSATTVDLDSQGSLKTLVQQKWNLVELETLYKEFLDFYRPLSKFLQSEAIEPRTSYLLRSLMLHEYRRILLRDPDFPEEMLPSGWVGFQAHDLAKRIYVFLAGSSCNFIKQCLENAQGPMPSVNPRFYKRFGGL